MAAARAERSAKSDTVPRANWAHPTRQRQQNFGGRRSAQRTAGFPALPGVVNDPLTDQKSLMTRKTNATIRNLGDLAMFKGKAELSNPENGDLVARFRETCHDDGTTVAEVTLHPPILLQDTEFLAIVGTATSTPIITAAASDPAGTEIHEFQGEARPAVSRKAETSRW
jgi:hypothetical protein